MPWPRLRDKDYGQGYHCRWNVWYYYIMELLPPWRFPCHVLYGRILHDSSVFAKLHPKHKTPVNSLYLIGALTMLAPFAGRTMMVWICDAGNFGCCLAYCMVSVSFLILRKKEPDMARPYKVGHYKFVGFMAVVMSGLMLLVYCIPGSVEVWYFRNGLW